MTQIPDDLKISSYDYFLSEDRVAQRPVPGRHHSKLLVYKVREDKIYHADFWQLSDFLPPTSFLVFNQSKVFPARLLGHKVTGGSCEVFFLSLTPSHTVVSVPVYQVLIKASGKRKIGDEFLLAEGVLKVRVLAIAEKDYFWVEVHHQVQVQVQGHGLPAILQQYGFIPIPPYIRQGKSDQRDLVDYQTIFAKDLGSVAAPTAGLHFTVDILQDLKRKGFGTGSVTLHVGLGTFSPVKVEDLTEHQMHWEDYVVTKENAEKIKKNSGRIIAVGTTSLRVLESCWQSIQGNSSRDIVGKTNIFLYPGKEVHSIQGLLTNFHLPKSTLLVLVSSLIGRKRALEIYAEAIEKEYRFFSYGDAMLILR